MPTNEKLRGFLSSTALVIDDEITDSNSTISKIILELEKQGTLFVKRRELIESIDSFSNLSFVILDWDLTKKEELANLPQGVSLGATLLDAKKNEIKSFIKKTTSKYFIPIFIFSRENTNEIQRFLEVDPDLKSSIEKNKIFLCNKSLLKNDQVINSLNEWLNNSMTVYTFKILEDSIEIAKHRFFNEMFKCDPNWPCHVYNTLKKDNPADINGDFQEFLMTSFTSTIEPIVFNNQGFDRLVSLNSSEILKIYSKIKFFAYDDTWVIGPHSGDIYISEDDGNEFYINVSASCDMRGEKYYFVKGKTTDNYEEKICLFIIHKVLNKQTICFDFRKVKILNKPSNINILPVNDKKYKRIGRLLSPYINVLQEKFSYYITRTGVLREPDEC